MNQSFKQPKTNADPQASWSIASKLFVDSQSNHILDIFIIEMDFIYQCLQGNKCARINPNHKIHPINVTSNYM